jgi:hydroxymethylpyrimidine pyrophosphatase-like HAD family hydrolase
MASTSSASSPLKLVSTDFDGTIHDDFEHAPIPVQLLDRLAALRAGGTTWVINTGRDLASLMESLGRARSPLMPDFVVTVEREIHRHVGGRYVAVEPWHSRCISDHGRAFAAVKPELDQLAAALESRYSATFYDDNWSPLCVIARSNAQMDAIQRELETFCGEGTALSMMRNDVYLRLCHRDYNKGAALAEIQRLIGVSPTETFAAGDHLNDIPMLDTAVARWIATPANGIPVVQARVASQGGFIASQNSGLGVLEALDWAAR